MADNFKPGDVALVDCGFGFELMWRGHGGWTNWGMEVLDRDVDAVHAPVVIDPEDREQVERLTHTFYAVRGLGEPSLAPSRIANMQAALREYASPTITVFEHFMAKPPSHDGTVTAMCGKVWRPGVRKVEIAGRCPECEEIVRDRKSTRLNSSHLP